MKIQCSNCGEELDRPKYRAIKGNCYCNAKCQMDYEYSSGARDKKTIALVANEFVRKNGQPSRRGKPSWNAGKIGECPQFAKFGAKNPMYGKFGKAHHGYKTGASIKRKRAWSRSIYQNWRKAVFAKDDYTCQICGDNKGGNLHAHHVRSWSDYEEGRYDIENGITYCETCHTNTHKMREKLHPKCRCTILPVVEDF